MKMTRAFTVTVLYRAMLGTLGITLTGLSAPVLAAPDPVTPKNGSDTSESWRNQYSTQYAQGSDFFERYFKSNTSLNITQPPADPALTLPGVTNLPPDTGGLASVADPVNAMPSAPALQLLPSQQGQSPRQAERSQALCRGAFVTPFDQALQVPTDPRQVTTVITADAAYYDPQHGSELSGDVDIRQPGRRIRADQLQLNADQTRARAQGRVELAQPGLLTRSDQIQYDLQRQTGEVSQSFYISTAQQAHGYAQQIRQVEPNITVLDQASFSTCAPQVVPPWHLEAEQLQLDRNSGRGTSRNTRLYVRDVPVMWLPYFNFPIDNRRSSGFLRPNLGYTNDGGLQLGIPYYFNLAPNFDLTATPRFVGGHGPMIEGDFRYLTQRYGSGRLWGGYLPGDDSYQLKDRQSLHWQHLMELTPQLSSVANFNYVSDKDYFTDLGTTPDSQDAVYQDRSWIINYHGGYPGLTAQLKLQKFQVLDPTILDVDQPYARLPQLLVHYQSAPGANLQYGISHDSAYFKKSLDNPVDVPKYPSGVRVYNHAWVNYQLRMPSLWVVPQVSLRSINTFYDRDTLADLGVNQNDSLQQSVAVPQFSVDSRLLLEKNGNYLQTLTPRLFYVYSPYRQQDGYPNFDSATASVNYDQLFSPYRFYGHDRLEDNHFASLGITYRLYDDIGLERLRAALGQSFYFADRRVRLNDSQPIDTSKTSGPVLSLSSQLSNSIDLHANAAWRSGGQLTFANLAGRYADDAGRTYSLGYYQRSQLPAVGQQGYQQVAFGMIQPVSERWRVIAQTQYDLHDRFMREWLLGAGFESCCWGMSVYARSYYNDLDDPAHQAVQPKRLIMAEFSLKGLGGLTGKLSSLLESRILGYDRLNPTWTTD